MITSLMYVCRNNQYWRLDEFQLVVAESLTDPYPRSTASWWFGCEQT
jgi:hypothetical protein